MSPWTITIMDDYAGYYATVRHGLEVVYTTDHCPTEREAEAAGLRWLEAEKERRVILVMQTAPSGALDVHLYPREEKKS